MIASFDENKSFEYENGFYLTSEPYRIGNILSHYELYKKIIDIPGVVIELGVFKGGSLIQFATFRELLENEKSRKIIGFDIFGKFPQVNFVNSDTNFVEKWNNDFEEEILTKRDLEKAIVNKGFNNIELIEGNILSTVEEYLKKYPYTRIALLHIDTDVYEPAKKGLELLYERIVPGGLLVLDDYGTIEGETLAVEEFFEGQNIEIHKMRFSHSKPSYIVKEKFA